MIRTARALALAALAGGTLAIGAYAQSNAQGTGIALSDDQAAERWVCRRATDASTQNAAMADAAHTALICRPLRIEARMMSNSSMVRIGSTRAKAAADGPDLSNALSPAQINDAWVRFVQKQLGEMPFTGGG